MTEEELSGLIGPSRLPSQDFIDFSKGGASSPEKAMKKMQNRESIKFMLNLMRRQSAQSANPYRDRDPLPLEMMEQRNIDPRDYGAALPPNAPQIPRQGQDRAWKSLMANMKRWQDQLSQRKQQTRYDFDREKWIDPPPPQLTGRFRDRMAF
jgi:hypothetical protein